MSDWTVERVELPGRKRRAKYRVWRSLQGKPNQYLLDGFYGDEPVEFKVLHEAVDMAAELNRKENK